MKILYLASLREEIGINEEELSPPDTVRTIADLMAWLQTRGPNYQAAFSGSTPIHAAIDFEKAPPEAEISKAGEIAFFPPMTGG